MRSHGIEPRTSECCCHRLAVVIWLLPAYTFTTDVPGRATVVAVTDDYLRLNTTAPFANPLPTTIAVAVPTAAPPPTTAPIELTTTTSSPAAPMIPASPGSIEVLAVGGKFPILGTLGAAGNDQQLGDLWTTYGFVEAVPQVDFSNRLVLAVIIPDDACPPTLTGFDESPAGTFTPIFVEPPGGCILPFIPRTFLISIERGRFGSTFTLRLPGSPNLYDEQLLGIQLDDTGLTTELRTTLPTLVTPPTSTALVPPG